MIKITSDGTAHGTRVTGPDGVPLKGITKIEILPLLPDEMLCATLTFCRVQLEIQAVQLAAEQYIEPPHPADAMGFDAWMRERTDGAHVAYMARNAVGGVGFSKQRTVRVSADGMITDFGYVQNYAYSRSTT